jgi:DNA mismatch repair ATPase MutL
MLLSGKGGSSIGASKSATLNQVRTLLGGLSLAWPAIRFSLVHNGSVIWRKQAVPASSQSPLQVALGETIGHAQASNLKLLSSSLDSWVTFIFIHKKSQTQMVH